MAFPLCFLLLLGLPGFSRGHMGDMARGTMAGILAMKSVWRDKSRPVLQSLAPIQAARAAAQLPSQSFPVPRVTGPPRPFEGAAIERKQRSFTLKNYDFEAASKEGPSSAPAFTYQ